MDIFKPKSNLPLLCTLLKLFFIHKQKGLDLFQPFLVELISIIFLNIFYDPYQASIGRPIKEGLIN